MDGDSESLVEHLIDMLELGTYWPSSPSSKRGMTHVYHARCIMYGRVLKLNTLHFSSKAVGLISSDVYIVVYRIACSYGSSNFCRPGLLTSGIIWFITY